MKWWLLSEVAISFYIMEHDQPEKPESPWSEVPKISLWKTSIFHRIFSPVKTRTTPTASIISISSWVRHTLSAKKLYRRSFTFWSLWIISSRFSERRYSKIIRLGQYFAGFSLRHNFFLIYDCELGSLLENNMVYWLLWLQSCATAIEKQKCGELLCLLEPGSFSVFRFIYKMMLATLEEVSSHASIDSTSIIQWMEKQRYRMANK